MDLAQACQPRVQFRQGAFKHLTVARIVDGLELLQDPPPRQLDGLLGLLPGTLFRCKSLF